MYITVYGTILANPTIFQLTSVESLQQMFYQHNISKSILGLIVVAIMLPLSQVRPDPHTVSQVALIVAWRLP